MAVDDAELHQTVGETELDRSVERLQAVSARLRRLGLVIFAGTVANLAAVVYLRTGARLDEDFLDFYYRDYALWVGVLTSLVLVFAVLHDQLRRTGDVIFEEISDEVQWHKQKHAGEAVVALERPLLHVRIALRRYAIAADLPLVRGRAGAAAYVGLNVLVLIGLATI
jgi:hypothetical protein